MRNEQGNKKDRRGENSKKSAKKRSGAGRPKPQNHKKYQKTEIVFDAEARQKHLQGFSARKRERRVFGLAMQKVKDRKARLEVRQSEREARLEQVQQAEKHKEEMMQAVLEENGGNKSLLVHGDDASVNDDRSIEKVEMYQDGMTQSMWGGEVVVKVSTHVPGDSSDDDGDTEHEVKSRKPRAKKPDEQQEFAGRVERYMPGVKASLPGKKKNATQQRKTKGMHGAANMKGMASNPGDFRLAQKALERASTAKKSGSRSGGTKRRR